MKFNTSGTEGAKRPKLVGTLAEDALLASIATPIWFCFHRESTAVWDVIEIWLSSFAGLIVYDLIKLQFLAWWRRRRSQQQTQGQP